MSFYVIAETPLPPKLRQKRNAKGRGGSRSATQTRDSISSWRMTPRRGGENLLSRLRQIEATLEATLAATLAHASFDPTEMEKPMRDVGFKTLERLTSTRSPVTRRVISPSSGCPRYDRARPPSRVTWRICTSSFAPAYSVTRRLAARRRSDDKEHLAVANAYAGGFLLSRCRGRRFACFVFACREGLFRVSISASRSDRSKPSNACI
jgi:hypothetical protein